MPKAKFEPAKQKEPIFTDGRGRMIDFFKGRAAIGEPVTSEEIMEAFNEAQKAGWIGPSAHLAEFSENQYKNPVRGDRKKREENRKLSNGAGELGTHEPFRIPKVILPELHDERSGRIDARKVADFMGVALEPLAEGLGLNYKAVHRSPSASAWQEALQPVKRSLELLHEFFGPKETIRIWLNTPHPYLDGETSMRTILEGKAFAVSRLLGNAWNGVPV